MAEWKCTMKARMVCLYGSDRPPHSACCPSTCAHGPPRTTPAAAPSATVASHQEPNGAGARCDAAVNLQTVLPRRPREASCHTTWSEAAYSMLLVTSESDAFPYYTVRCTYTVTDRVLRRAKAEPLLLSVVTARGRAETRDDHQVVPLPPGRLSVVGV